MPTTPPADRNAERGSEALSFPTDFVWGAATASYQIEGAVDEGGRSASIWDTFSHTPGMVVDGDTGDVACDHYHRYREDVALLADLGVSHYRFSLAWPRLQPEGRGALNEAGLDFYVRLVEALLERDITPWVTLYHWDLPQVLEDAGGWPARETAQRFADYSAAVHARLHDRVHAWTTLNEPWVAAFLGYAAGEHAPGVRDPAQALRAAHHLLLGHGLALEAMRAQDPGTSTFGITLNFSPVRSATEDEADVEAARRIDALQNRLFLDPLLRGRYAEDLLEDVADVTDGAHVQEGDLERIAQPLDFLGVNYYFPWTVRAGGRATAPSPWVGSEDVEFVDRGLPTTAMGWEIEPDGLRETLTRLSDEYAAPPLYVTENGAAFDEAPGPDGVVQDANRIAYLDGHFRAAHAARERGADVRGYFVWSLLDNFEWAFGFSRRFGLVHVDYPTQRRTPKASAGWYAQVTRRNGLPAA